MSRSKRKKNRKFARPSKAKSFSLGAAGSGYDAANSSGKRRAASSIIKHEDEYLKDRQRQTLAGAGQYLHRNFSMVAWAVRKHLDYNTHFQFQARTDNETLNNQIEALMSEWSLPFNCEASARFNLSQFIRTSEMRRVIDGDLFWVKRRDGKLGAVEADLIQTPDKNTTGQTWFNGGRVNKDGRPIQWGLWKRQDGGTYEFLRKLDGRNVIHFSSPDRFDQVRGISPLAGAFNSFQDVYEGVDYALAKMKVEQLFAMIVHNTNSSGMGEHTRVGDGKYDVDFGKGPIKMEMEGDDDVRFLTSDNPGSNTQDFLELVLSMAIKSLDLPINFVDESRTNFFGSRAAWMLYDRSCIAKRAIILEALRRVTIWKLRQWIIQGLLVLPTGMTVYDVAYEWVHIGMPWWDPSKEIEGDTMAIAAGLDNPYRICKERGRGEFEENIRLRAKAEKFALSQGVELNYSPDAASEEVEEVEEDVEDVEDVEDDQQEEETDDD